MAGGIDRWTVDTMQGRVWRARVADCSVGDEGRCCKAVFIARVGADDEERRRE